MRINPNADFAAIVATKTLIAAGTADSFTGRNTTGRDVYISRFRVRAFYDGAQTDDDGTPLANSSSTTANNTTAKQSSLVTINVKIGNESWFTQEISLGVLFDDNTGWFKFERVLPKVTTDQEISISYTNGSGKIIRLRALFEGLSVPKGEKPVVN